MGAIIPSNEEAAEAAALADSLRPMILKLGRRLRLETQKLGVSAVDAQLLGIIAQRPGIGISELAALEHVSRPSMSAHVKRLVAAGWIARETPADGDQRRARLILSDEGRRSVAAIRQRRTDWLAERIARLDPAERAALAAAIAPAARLVELQP